MSRRAALTVLVAALAGALAPAARASTFVTWDMTSRFVTPAQERLNPPQTGVPRTSPLPVRVLLPDGYDAKRAYPVLYLLHGHGDAYDGWSDPGHGDVQQILAGLQAIVVMPEGGRGWYTNWWSGGARSPAWERYHLDELIPFVEHKVRILPGRRWHAIAGLSMGGEGAIYYASQRPGYFGSAASFSGVLDLLRPEWPAAFDTQGESHTDVFGDPQAQRFYWVGHDPTSLVGNLRSTRVFITVGDGTTTMPSEATNYFGMAAEAELRQHADDFVAAARAAGVDVTYQPRDGVHDWPYWRRALAAARAWGFFRGPAARPPSWSLKTVSQHGVAWDMTFDFAKPPDTLITFRRHDDTISATGSGRVTMRFAGRARPLVSDLPFAGVPLPPPRARRSRPCARSAHARARRCRRARAPRAWSRAGRHGAR